MHTLVGAYLAMWAMCLRFDICSHLCADGFPSRYAISQSLLNLQLSIVNHCLTAAQYRILCVRTVSYTNTSGDDNVVKRQEARRQT